MRTVEGFLSRRAQAVFPGALVYHEDRANYVIEVPGQKPLGLGRDFGEAKRAIDAIINAESHRRAQGSRMIKSLADVAKLVQDIQSKKEKGGGR